MSNIELNLVAKLRKSTNKETLIMIGFVDDFIKEMQQELKPVDLDTIYNSNIDEVTTYKGIGDKKRIKCWIVWHETQGSGAVCTYGSSSTSQSFTWRARALENLPRTEQKEQAIKIKKSLQLAFSKAKEDRKEKHKQAALMAIYIYNLSLKKSIYRSSFVKKNRISPVNARTAYLSNTALNKMHREHTASGVDWLKPNDNPYSYIVIPITKQGKTINLQLINDTDHNSKYIPGAELKGGSLFIEALSGNSCLVCSNYETGAALRLATSLDVFICFEVWNIKHVVEGIVAENKYKDIIIAVDNLKGKEEKEIQEALVMSHKIEVITPDCESSWVDLWLSENGLKKIQGYFEE